VRQSAHDTPPREPPRRVGRYELYARIATGGMASVYFGRLVGPVGFSRTVAIKRLHPQFAQDPEFVAMFLDEARLAGRIRHPNVIPTLDVVALQDELFLVMEYVQGESLGRLVRAAATQNKRVPLPVLTTIFLNVLDGLEAAHEVTDDAGRPLGIVHRDVSPQNIIVGVDGVSRVLDFGVAKASGRTHQTKSGMTKGKIAYMAPEQIVSTSQVTRAADIYGVSVCLWEALTGDRLFRADNDAALMQLVLTETVRSPRDVVPDVPEAIARLTLEGLSKNPASRPRKAEDMARALAAVSRPATAMEVTEWVRATAKEALSSRAAIVAAIERDSDVRVSKAAQDFVDRIKVDPMVTVDVEGADLTGEEPSRSRSASGVLATASAIGPPSSPAAPSRTRRAILWSAAIGLAAAIAAAFAVSLHKSTPDAREAAATVPASAAEAVSAPASGEVPPATAPVPPPPAGAATSAEPVTAASTTATTTVTTKALATTPSATVAPRPVRPSAAKPANVAAKPAQNSDGLFDRR
jgi:eukaryotic-like serine/threonine-protein kinase